jgi:hypothetical protein
MSNKQNNHKTEIQRIPDEKLERLAAIVAAQIMRGEYKKLIKRP